MCVCVYICVYMCIYIYIYIYIYISSDLRVPNSSLNEVNRQTASIIDVCVKSLFVRDQLNLLD